MSKVVSDWRTIVDGWEASRPGRANVRMLVHLAMRMDQIDQAAIQKEIFREKRQSYEDTLTSLAKQAGQSVSATADNATLKQMMKQAKTEAAGIVNTYNYDLAKQIDVIRAKYYSPNRNLFAKELQAWHAARSSWKDTMISLVNRVEWQGKAVADFAKLNAEALKDVLAQLMPATHAVCDICKHWIAQGAVPVLQVIKVMEEWPPHPNCVHEWVLVNVKPIAKADLWAGG